MTVEGEKDDICSIGQTLAAQDLLGTWACEVLRHSQGAYKHNGRPASAITAFSLRLLGVG